LGNLFGLLPRQPLSNDGGVVPEREQDKAVFGSYADRAFVGGED